MDKYYDVISPGPEGKLLCEQCNRDNVEATFHKLKTCIVLKWRDYGYDRIAQKNLQGFCDHTPIAW